MKSHLFKFLFIPLFFIACGKDSHEHDSGSEKGHHVHVAPHGGQLVEVGEHGAGFNLELVLHADGFLQIYVLDAHAENFVRIPAYSMSFEIQDIPLIAYTASKGKPIIISTGIAEEDDVQLAVDTCRKVGNNEIILLKCTSSYPAPLELANLNTIPDLKQRFDVEVGFSDHTYGSLAPTVAVTLGAKVIEKHFILDKSIGGPDADFSLDVAEFTEMVSKVRDVEKLLGTVSYEISEKVKNNKKFARSLFVCENVKKGEIITKENIRSIRPGYGLHPKYYDEILGETFSQDVERGTPMSLKFID